MKVIYIAGPYRGKDNWEIHQNVNRASALALEVWRLGAAALCPHANTAHFQFAAPDEVWLNGDLELLSRCDALIVTPDWEQSSGARAEVRFADENDIPVFFTLGTLARYLRAAHFPVLNTLSTCSKQS